MFAFALYLLPPLGLSGSGLRPFLLGFEAGALPVPWPHACGLAPALVRLALLLLRSSPSLLLVFLEPQTYLRICRWGTSGFAPRTFFFLQLGTGAGSPLPPILSRVWTSSPSGVGFVPPPQALGTPDYAASSSSGPALRRLSSSSVVSAIFLALLYPSGSSWTCARALGYFRFGVSFPSFPSSRRS